MTLCSAGLPNSGMWKCDPAFGDVNQDGFLDLAAIPRQGDGTHVWLGNGEGAWKDSSTGLNPGVRSCGGGLSFGDVNNDGHLDLAVADHCHGVFVYLGDGAGHWKMVARGLHAPGAKARAETLGSEDLDLADVNGDGALDILAGSSDFDGTGISVYLGDGTGTNWVWMESGLPSHGSANRVRFSDVDGDGLPDVVATYGPGPRVWRGDGEGGWTPASVGLPAPMIHGLYRGLAVGDVNEDGRADLAAANWVDGPEVFLQGEDGAWTKTADVFPEMLGGAVGLSLNDMNRDGHLDLLVSGRLTQDVGFVYGVFLLLGDGQGNWTYVRDTGLPETGLAFTWGVAAGDVNGDGILDGVAGSGGIVATVPDVTEPVVPPRLLCWCTLLRDSPVKAPD